MTVKELIDRLGQFAPEAEVTACWDCIPSWEVHSVIAYRGRAVLDVHGGDVTADDMAEYDGLTKGRAAD